MDKIFIAVEANAADNDTVRLGFYRCKRTKQNVVATDLFADYSPFASNSIMRKLSGKPAVIKVKHIRKDNDLTTIGSCPACQTEHFVAKAQAAELVNSSEPLHCTLCSAEYAPVLPSEVLAGLIDDGDDNSEDDEELETAAADEEDGDEEITATEADDADDNDSDDNDSDAAAENNTATAEDHTDPIPAVLETQNIENNPAEEIGNDLNTDAEIVSASTTEFNIDCLASAGDLASKNLMLVQLNPQTALVLADEMPVARLLAAKAGDNAKLFNDPAALAKTFKAVVAAGSADFSQLGGEPISYTVNVAEQIQQKIAAGVATATAELTEEKKTIGEELRAAFAIAASIINKNIEKDAVNPIREQLVEVLTQRNVQPLAASQIADSVLENTAGAYSQAIFNKTEELMQKPLAARNEIGQFVLKSAYVKPVLANTADDTKDKAIDKLANNSVLISTAGGSDTAPSVTASQVPASSDPGVNHFRNLLRSKH